MLASVNHILPLTNIRRERLLPAPGKILVRKGQQVSATDVIGESQIAPEHQLLDVARALGLPPDEVDSYLRCSAGIQVSEGDVLAGPVGFTKRVLRAPCDGRVIVAGSGQVLLEIDSRPVEVLAGLSGVVIDLLGDRGVVVEAKGALVQGVWGNGKIDFGTLYVLAKARDHELTVPDLDASMRGLIVMGGHCSSQDVLQMAGELPLRGLILGSLDVSLHQQAAKLELPVVVLQDWGRQPINTATFRLLSTSDQREVSLNAQPWDRYTGQRPEIVINLPAGSQVHDPADVLWFSVGQRVHLIRTPYQGQIGVLTAIRPGRSRLPSGITAQVADVRLENGEDIVVPLANLEVLA